jgi:RNA polymerase sigma factor (sigma-70 family)
MGYRAVGLTPEQEEYVRLALSHLKGWGDHPDYDDLIGEALLGAFQSVAEEKQSGKQLKSVAYVGAGSSIKNFWRHKSRQKRSAEVVQIESLCGEVGEPRMADFSSELVDRIGWNQVLQSALNPFEQKMMRLIYLEGMSGEEVATAEGVTRKRVYNVVYKATRKLRAALGVNP